VRLVYSILLVWLFILTACQSVNKKGSANPNAVTPPQLLKPEVKRTWIPPEIQDGGRVYIDGHWRYEVERSGSFGR
jgi:hypothetical protein